MCGFRLQADIHPCRLSLQSRLPSLNCLAQAKAHGSWFGLSSRDHLRKRSSYPLRNFRPGGIQLGTDHDSCQYNCCAPCTLPSPFLSQAPSNHANDEGTAEDMTTASSSTSTELQAIPDPADKEQGAHGCMHYRRRCRLVAPCCGEVFWCRHCHNEAKSQDEMVCLAAGKCYTCTPEEAAL